MTISEQTPGQQRTAAARATRTRQANERAAARLREADYVVIPGRCIRAMANVLVDNPDVAGTRWAEGYGAALQGIAEVSDDLGKL